MRTESSDYSPEKCHSTTKQDSNLYICEFHFSTSFWKVWTLKKTATDLNLANFPFSDMSLWTLPAMNAVFSLLFLSHKLKLQKSIFSLSNWSNFHVEVHHCCWELIHQCEASKPQESFFLGGGEHTLTLTHFLLAVSFAYQICLAATFPVPQKHIQFEVLLF